MTKATHLREMSPDQLEFSLTEAKKELFRLRFQAATEKLDCAEQSPQAASRDRPDLHDPARTGHGRGEEDEEGVAHTTQGHSPRDTVERATNERPV